jgi:hypothetical protein
MQPQVPTVQPMSPFQKIFQGWLAKALTLSCIISLVMVSFAYGADIYYQDVFVKSQKSNPSEVLAPFASPSTIVAQITNGVQTPTLTLAPNVTSTPTPRVTQAPGNTATNTQTPTPTHVSNATNTPTSPPQATNTNSPTPTQGQVAGCYVVVSGYLYNMQNAIGANAIDPNTGKAHVHTTNDYQCGTQSSPTDMTAVYLDKHLAMGCAARLAPYIVTPPAPADPSCD